jgi:hypothetical protein
MSLFSGPVRRHLAFGPTSLFRLIDVHRRVIFPAWIESDNNMTKGRYASNDSLDCNSVPASPSDAEVQEILKKLDAWTLAHFVSADYPRCPVCQGTRWTWQSQVQASAVGRRSVYRICNACNYAMRFDADTIGI